MSRWQEPFGSGRPGDERTRQASKHPPHVHIVWFGQSIVGVYDNRPAAEAVMRARNDYNRERWGDRAGTLQAWISEHEVQTKPREVDL